MGVSSLQASVNRLDNFSQHVSSYFILFFSRNYVFNFTFERSMQVNYFVHVLFQHQTNSIHLFSGIPINKININNNQTNYRAHCYLCSWNHGYVLKASSAYFTCSALIVCIRDILIKPL